MTRGKRRIARMTIELLVGILSLSAPAAARADVVVDWTVIAGNAAGGVNGGAREHGGRLAGHVRSGERHHR